MFLNKTKEKELEVLTRLQLNPEEEITRKEYLKRKKKQEKNFNKKSKISYIMIACFSLLAIYVFTQFYVYSKTNNFKYVAGDGVNAQKVYNMYYVTEGYTYDPVYSLNSINSDGFNDTQVYQNSGMYDIVSKNDYIYGIKNNSFCRFSKKDSNIEVLVSSNILKYTLTDSRAYYIDTNSTLNYIDLVTKQQKNLAIGDVCEVLVDSNNIFVTKIQKSKKILVRYDLEGGNETILNENANISYIVQDESSIYFVNKSDENKIYKVAKTGGDSIAFNDSKSISDNGSIKEIDGRKYMFISNNKLYYINSADGDTLWRVNFEDCSVEKVIYVAVQILQNVDNTVFYKAKNEMGIYLYNYDTKFMSKITNRNVKEFSIDESSDNISEIQQKNKK